MDQPAQSLRSTAIEWPTIGLIAGCYAAWVAAGLLHAAMPWAAVALLVLTIVLHASLQHEVIHRHPTRSAAVNAALVWLPLGPLIPFGRFRDQHLLHHRDARLTDPYDDPESYYLARGDWDRLPRPVRRLLAWNNRLAVRMLVGPAIMAAGFLWSEARLLVSPGARAVRLAWASHAIGLAAMLLIVARVFTMPVVDYLIAAYLAQSLLALRSYCEHQWSDDPGARTVIVERSVLGLLFLNNNYHVVHHAHPAIAWYALPAAFRARRSHWLAINRGYVFRGYGAVLRRFAIRAKEPVPHPAR